MHNYDYFVPTRLVFGRGRLGELSKYVSGRGKRVLITYGGGSIKKLGLYDRLRELLRDFEVFELSGIEPNPRIDSVRKGVEIVKRENIDFIVAAGGGSVIDCTKNIAAGACYDGDPWDLVMNPRLIGKHVPFFAVLTLSATGSEYDGSGVITNPATNEKNALMGEIFPEVSIMDPEYTFSVNAWQTAAGSADIMSHVFESYLVRDGNIFTDGICEAMLKTVIECTPKALKNPEDYEARAQLMMVSSFGCCGLPALGRTPSPWVCHGIEHEVSAFYDITHGAGLAILTPPLMRYSLSAETAPRFAQYGVRVFGLNPDNDVMANAEEAIRKTADFFKSIGLPATLREAGIPSDEHFGEMADHIIAHWFGDFKNALKPLGREDIIAILKDAL
ncbi:iron-containing alcohol dehydrogenase [Succinimonas amylolytica]|uniref:iron-containing alcohol dehydrogenase n=1 Tax=Succinimonas amylolytica TaxID=83769 RepID=UPI0023A8CF6A